MFGILGSIKEYFWGLREHAVKFLVIGELNKSEHLKLLLGNKEETLFFF